MKSSLQQFNTLQYVCLLALVATLDMELEQLDGSLEEDILMQQPKGFEVQGKENSICRLKKFLYGLRQSPRQWYKRFDEFIASHGYSRHPYDSCVYHIKVKNGSHIYFLLYEDDMLIASQDKSEIQNLKSLLSSEFEMKEIGATEEILCMEIKRD